MQVQDVPISDLPRRQLRPDAAAVDKGDIRPHHRPVGVGAEVPQVGLPAPDPVFPGGRVGGDQGHVRAAHHLAQLLLILGLDSGDLLLHFRVPAGIAGHQLRLDLPGDGVQDHLADGGQAGARLGQHHVLPLPVGQCPLILLMGVAV